MKDANRIEEQNQGFLFESHLMKGEGHTISSETLELTQNFIKKNV